MDTETALEIPEKDINYGFGSTFDADPAFFLTADPDPEPGPFCEFNSNFVRNFFNEIIFPSLILIHVILRTC
jgi:hypothetical protein